MTESLFLFLSIVQFIIFLCGMGIVFYFCYVLWTLHRDLPYVPTPYRVIRRMIRAAEITANDVVLDLGSGTGRIVIEVARQYAVPVTGVERSRMLLVAAKLRAACTRRRGKITWVHGDFFMHPLGGTTVILSFLIPKIFAKLVSKFEELPNGARIVSYKFPIPLSSAWESSLIPHGKNDRFYLYKKVGV